MTPVAALRAEAEGMPAGGLAARFSAWHIELTTRCPLACRMCIRQGPDGWRSRDMRLADFEKLAGQLGEVRTVMFQGWGEPLLHEHLVAVVRLAKGAGRRSAGPGLGASAPSVGIVTSGKGLDRRYAAELVGAGLDFIGFSLAGATAETHSALRVGSELGEVLSAAEHVQAIKRQEGRRSPRTHVVFLMLKDNIGELPALPALARRMGADEIVLTNLIHVVDPWQDGQKVFGAGERAEYRAILAETEERARGCGVALRRPALSPEATPVCEEDPLRNLYVSVEGNVSPCAYLDPPVSEEFTRRFRGGEHRVRRVCFGNAFLEPVSAIFDGAAYAAFRARFERRAEPRRLRCLERLGSPPQLGGSRGEALPDAPEPCRTCHKLLGV